MNLHKFLIKFYPFDYLVKISKSKKFAEGHFGETYPNEKVIKLSHTKDTQILKHFLLHECLHVLLEDTIEVTASIKDLEEREEAIVRLVTPKLQSFIENNPKLMEYFMEKDEG